ncbi:MAG TPA: hypothetical protein VMG30_05740 [Acidobacteriota bacterium]|nr:hypothetical protein [Acidobacteriota bacterium]
MRNRCATPPCFISGTVSLLLLSIAFLSASPASCQDAGTNQGLGAEVQTDSHLRNHLFAYLNVANEGQPFEFQPRTQKQRNREFAKILTNPLWIANAALSAGVNQWADTPRDWEQGASGYGKRFADFTGQYAIRKTVTFGFESLLHEDNRYLGSGKKGFWSRAGYALSSGVMARHDNGRRYPSASLLLGFASAAGLSRFWQPPSDRSAADAAIRFGISMGGSIGFGVMKEFLPDLLKRGPKQGKP